ncbi:MAG TPA: hypothetical protein VIK75_08870 [Calditerricola sp.]
MRVFQKDERLGIELPVLEKPWAAYTREEREAILKEWERIRGTIPSRIKALEAEIEALQARLYQTDREEEIDRLWAAVCERASRINDLNNWYRTQPDVEPDPDIAAEHREREK